MRCLALVSTRPAISLRLRFSGSRSQALVSAFESIRMHLIECRRDRRVMDSACSGADLKRSTVSCLKSMPHGATSRLLPSVGMREALADNGAPYPCVALRADLIDVRNLLLRPQPDMSVPKFFELHEALERLAAALVKDHSEAIDAISTLLNRHGMVTRADIEASLKFGRRYLSDRSLPLREGTEH